MIVIRDVDIFGRVRKRRASARMQEAINSLVERLEDTPALTVGLHRDAQDYHDDGGNLGANEVTGVVEVGAKHEFGVGNFPARPWLSRSIKAEKRAITANVTKALKIAADGGNATGQYKKMGRKLVTAIRQHVEGNDIGLAANAPSTVEAKGGNQPMVDTGHLLRQVDYKVYDDG